MPVPILAASDLIQALTLIIATFGFYADFFSTIEKITKDRMAPIA